MTRFQCGLLAFAGALGWGCDETPERADGLQVSGAWEPRSVWEPALAEVVSKRCGECHGGEGPAPQRLTDATEVEQAREAVASAVRSGTMPPWAPSPDCIPLAATRALSNDERERILAWADAGLPLTERFDASHPTRETTTPPDLTIALTLPVSEAREDIYPCVHATLPIDSQRFVWRARVVSEHPFRLHHASLFAGPLGAREDGCPDARTILGGAGVGTPPMTLPDGVGAPLTPSDELAIDLHYGAPDLGATTTLADNLRVELWLYPVESPPDAVWTVATATSPDFVIPAGDASFEATGEVALAPNQLAIGFIPHMHSLGRVIREELVNARDETVCVGAIRSWQFDHQDAYFFVPSERFVTAEGDRLQVHCLFDNSAANQPLLAGQQEVPRDVSSGWLAGDEMCMGSLLIEVPR